jgi:hypothetical protein
MKKLFGKTMGAETTQLEFFGKGQITCTLMGRPRASRAIGNTSDGKPR